MVVIFVYTELGRDIEQINPEALTRIEAHWVHQIRENYPHLEKLFTALTEVYEGERSTESVSTKQILVQSLQLRSSVMVQAANQLSILSLQAIRATKRDGFLLLGMAAASLLLITGLLFFTKRRIARSLQG